MSVIRIENLTFAYPGSFDNVFEDANIQIDTDWKLGFVGRNGRGKTNAYIAGSGIDVGADLFKRGLCLPSDNKMTPEQQDIIIDIIHRCFE